MSKQLLRTWWLLALICLTVFMLMLDSTLVNVNAATKTPAHKKTSVTKKPTIKKTRPAKNLGTSKPPMPPALSAPPTPPVENSQTLGQAAVGMPTTDTTIAIAGKTVVPSSKKPHAQKSAETAHESARLTKDIQSAKGHAFVDSINSMFKVAALVALLGSLIALFLRVKPRYTGKHLAKVKEQ